MPSKELNRIVTEDKQAIASQASKQEREAEVAYRSALKRGDGSAEEEAAIAKSPRWSYNYARKVVEGAFPKGEQAIASDPGYAYEYARYVLKRRFPAGERAISSDKEYSMLYARNVVEKMSRFYQR